MAQGFAKTPTYLWAAINAAAAGNNTIIAASGSKIYSIVAITFTCASNVTVSFLSDAVVLISPMSFAGGGGMDVNRAPYGYFCRTVTGDALIMTLSGTVNVRGSLMYEEL